MYFYKRKNVLDIGLTELQFNYNNPANPANTLNFSRLNGNPDKNLQSREPAAAKYKCVVYTQTQKQRALSLRVVRLFVVVWLFVNYWKFRFVFVAWFCAPFISPHKLGASIVDKVVANSSPKEPPQRSHLFVSRACACVKLYLIIRHPASSSTTQHTAHNPHTTTQIAFVIGVCVPA